MRWVESALFYRPGFNHDNPHHEYATYKPAIFCPAVSHFLDEWLPRLSPGGYMIKKMYLVALLSKITPNKVIHSEL
jgi:hypothetical protein